MTILIILLLIIIAVLAYDLWEEFLVWLGRIKVGQLSEEEWQSKTKNVLLRWIEKGAPEVLLNENGNMKFIRKINNYGKITSVMYWQDASLLKGANHTAEDVGSEVTAMAARYIPGNDGEWRVLPKRIDAAMLCYELLSSRYTDAQKIKPSMDYVAGMLGSMAEKHGTIPYNESVPEYRFVDAVGMTCPFLIKYALTYNEEKYIDLAMKQIKEYYEHGVNKDFGIPYHCFKENTFEPLGVCGWGRGCAWWALGLTDSLKTLLETDGYNKEKAVLLRYLIEILDAVKKYIKEDGTVERMLFNSSLQDSSACAMLAYCYAYMAELLKNEEYKALAAKMREKLRSVTRRNGIVDFSQGDTHGIGFYSEKLCVVPAAQGFMVALNEMLGK